MPPASSGAEKAMLRYERDSSPSMIDPSRKADMRLPPNLVPASRRECRGGARIWEPALLRIRTCAGLQERAAWRSKNVHAIV